jgi:hypothetical protein
VSGTWQNLGATLNQAVENAPFEKIQAFSDRLNSFTTTLSNNIAEIDFAIQSAIDEATQPIDAVRRLIGVMSSIQDSAGSVLDELRDAPAQVQFALQEPTTGLVPFANVCAAELWKRGVYDAARAAQRQAALQAQDLGRQVNPDLIAVVVARDGDDLRDISTDAYGTPDQWKALEAYNGLTSSALSAGDVVFVPQFTTEDQ